MNATLHSSLAWERKLRWTGPIILLCKLVDESDIPCHIDVAVTAADTTPRIRTFGCPLPYKQGQQPQPRRPSPRSAFIAKAKARGHAEAKPPRRMIRIVWVVVLCAVVVGAVNPCSYHFSSVIAFSSTGFELELRHSGTCQIFGEDVPVLRARARWITPTSVECKVWDPNENRAELPASLLPGYPQDAVEPALGNSVSFERSPFGFVVRRGHETLVNTSGSLIFEPNFLELTVGLKKENMQEPVIFGLGERRGRFRLDATPGSTFVLWSTNHKNWVDTNLYGAEPFFLQLLRQTGNCHGVYFASSAPQEVRFLDVETLRWRSASGVVQFFIFTGTSASMVNEQFTSLIGRPQLPPLWALGNHQSRWPYGSLDAVRENVAQFEEFDIPLDVQWTDLDYMDGFRDFTVDPVAFNHTQMKLFLDHLHSVAMRWVPILDPNLGSGYSGYEPYDTAVSLDLFLKRNATNAPWVGHAWAGNISWPDFAHPKAIQWWTNLVSSMHSAFPFSGLWLDKNEPTGDDVPASFQPRSNSTGPSSSPLPWTPLGDDLNYRTVDVTCWSDHNGTIAWQRDFHSLFGHFESVATYDALKVATGERPFILSRSTFPGTGHFAAHWLGDNWSTWSDMTDSISGILSFGLYGMPFVGADICGFDGATTEDLCVRWYELGMFYPFSRNHNNMRDSHPDIHVNATPQEPWAFGHGALARIRSSIRRRYEFLPYLYSLFEESSRTGIPVWRAPAFSFYCSSNAQSASFLDCDTQVLVGSALWLCPVLSNSTDVVNCLIPSHSCEGGTERVEVFYDLWTGARVSGPSVAANGSSTIPVFFRGGNVIPTATNVGLSVEDTLFGSSSSLTLLAALDVDGNANGSLYSDDGRSFSIAHCLRTSMSISCDNGTEDMECMFQSIPLSDFVSETAENPQMTVMISSLVVYGSTATASWVVETVIDGKEWSSASVSVSGETVHISWASPCNFSKSIVVKWHLPPPQPPDPSKKVSRTALTVVIILLALLSLLSLLWLCVCAGCPILSMPFGVGSAITFIVSCRWRERRFIKLTEDEDETEVSETVIF